MAVPLRSRTTRSATTADRRDDRSPGRGPSRRPHVVDLTDDEPLGLAPGRAPRRGADGSTDDALSAPRRPEARPATVARRASSGGPSPAAQLRRSLDDLVDVFGTYPFHPSMPACAHCVTDADLRAIGRQPSTIPAAVLDRYVGKAMVTWGEVDDFKRLLPEILTRLTDGRSRAPGALVGVRLRRAGWTSWPAAETPAVRRTLQAVWLTTFTGPPGPGQAPVSSRLALLTAAESDISPALDLWEDRLEAPGDPAARLAAVLHLADLLAPLAVGGRRRLTRGFPLARRSVVAQLDHWLRQPVVVQRLAHAAGALEATPHGPLVAQARSGLARLRTEG